MTAQARQGHTYTYAGMRVIALESGDEVRVAQIVPGSPWLGTIYTTEAARLTPLPMVYFGGQVPG